MNITLLRFILAAVQPTHFANDLDAFVPEIWAQESLMILEANMVAANLVHRDFENLVANFGDTVNTRLPAEFQMARKTDADNVTVQDAIATNVPVLLNQHIHASFVIKDGEESKGFPVLREVYLEPAMLSLAQGIDEIVLGQVYQFLALNNGSPNVVGQLGVGASKQTVIAAREKLNDNRVPQIGRNLILTTSSEADLLAVDLFMGANTVGDDGTALKEASLGKKYGLQTYMSQNTPSPSGAVPSDVGAVNLLAGYPAGTVAMTVDSFTAALIPGAWFTVAGDDTPQRIVTQAGGPPPTSITFFPGLANAVADNAVITVYENAQVNQAVAPAGYATGYAKDLIIDTNTVAPRIGQMASFDVGAGLGTNYSSILSPNSPALTSLALNRPLAAAAGDNAVIGLGPNGSFNFAFHKNALALVTRPLAPPQAGTGALSFVANFNGLSMRVTITYDGNQQGHLVTCDALCGVKVLDRRLGCVVLG